MSPREVNKLLFDVQRACERILKYLEGRSLENFADDDMLQSAVERQSEIIGEALNQALDREPSLRERITNVRRIIDFRNRLIHGYASVSPQIVWGIVSSEVPLLLREVRSILGEV